MKLLITGSRTLNYLDYDQLALIIKLTYPDATEIWHGGAEGADHLAARYARENQLAERVIRPDYQTNGTKLAPLVRNKELVAATNCTLAAYKGQLTPGTEYTARQSMKAGHETTLADLWTGLHWTNAGTR